MNEFPGTWTKNLLRLLNWLVLTGPIFSIDPQTEMENSVQTLFSDFFESRAEKCAWRLLICMSDLSVRLSQIMTVDQCATGRVFLTENRSGTKTHVDVSPCQTLFSVYLHVFERTILSIKPLEWGHFGKLGTISRSSLCNWTIWGFRFGFRVRIRIRYSWDLDKGYRG